MTRFISEQGIVDLAIIGIFFVSHWALAAFVQVFFLHRYASHRQFTMSPGWERVFHLLTYFVLGSSYLPPRAYAVLHRMHHTYADGPLDPHSPANHRSPLSMTMAMRKAFDDLAHGKVQPEARFDGRCPRWPALERIGWSPLSQITWGIAYGLVYIVFAPVWLWPLVFVHIFMAPIQGAMVNWCGHRYGYRNHDSSDRSTNTIGFDLIMLGDFMQNNHHHRPMHISTAERWFELDLVGKAVVGMSKLGIVKLR